MRLPLGRSGILAAAAVAGGVVCWRVVERRRSRDMTAGIEEAIAEGRQAANRVLGASDGDDQRFEQP